MAIKMAPLRGTLSFERQKKKKKKRKKTKERKRKRFHEVPFPGQLQRSSTSLVSFSATRDWTSLWLASLPPTLLLQAPETLSAAKLAFTTKMKEWNSEGECLKGCSFTLRYRLFLPNCKILADVAKPACFTSCFTMFEKLTPCGVIRSGWGWDFWKSGR